MIYVFNVPTRTVRLVQRCSVFSNSVIQQTGQFWKLAIAVLALLVGSFAPIWPETGISWTAGTILAIGGYIFGCLSIACPDCKKKWFWEALMRAEWYKPLFTEPTCPACSKEFRAG